MVALQVRPVSIELPASGQLGRENHLVGNRLIIEPEVREQAAPLFHERRISIVVPCVGINDTGHQGQPVVGKHVRRGNFHHVGHHRFDVGIVGNVIQVMGGSFGLAEYDMMPGRLEAYGMVPGEEIDEPGVKPGVMLGEAPVEGITVLQLVAEAGPAGADVIEQVRLPDGADSQGGGAAEHVVAGDILLLRLHQVHSCVKREHSPPGVVAEFRTHPVGKLVPAVITVPGDGIGAVDDAVLSLGHDVVVFAEVALEVIVKAYSEFSLDVRRKHQLAFGMEGIARPGTQEEPAVVADGGVRLHLDTVRRELVGALVRVVEHGVVEVPVELQQGVRDGHLDVLFLNLHGLSLVVVGDLDRRVEVLGAERRAGQQGRSKYDIASHSGLHHL